MSTQPNVVSTKQRLSPQAKCEGCAWAFSGHGSGSAARGHTARTGHAVVVARTAQVTYLRTELHA